MTTDETAGCELSHYVALLGLRHDKAALRDLDEELRGGVKGVVGYIMRQVYDITPPS